MNRTQVLDKATCEIVQGQRVHSKLYGGRDGIVIGVRGEANPGSIRRIGAGISMGGGASYDIAFEDHISHGIPECIVRGVQWEIYAEVGDADAIIDAVAAAKLATETARLKQLAAQDRRAAERDALRMDAKYAHLLQPHQKPTWGKERLAAENIRRELKRTFPGHKFKVTSDNNSVNVSWTDGPTLDEVKGITDRHQIGNFNGMTDSYEQDDEATFADVFGGAKYVFESRDRTDAALCAAFAEAYPNGITCDGKTFTAFPVGSVRSLTHSQEHHLYEPWKTKSFPPNFGG